MKLLDRKTVNTVMAGERKSQIDEGVILAKKIDAMRESYSSLQTQQQLFVDSISTSLTDRTNALNEEIYYKENIVKDLEQKRIKLLEPLTIKWDEVKKAEEDVAIWKEEQIKKGKELFSVQQVLEEREKEISLEEERMVDLKKQINLQVDKVYESSLKAQNTLLAAIDRETEINAQLATKKRKIEEKEQEVLVRERNAILKEELLKRDEEEIIKTKLQLADQRATLNRAFARLK